ncbi:MAG: GbsR/MarR family transcriptional regulator [Myxococcales bacterium]|nr:MarR family transcriptional regulator [Myxococcales bacterium]
MAMRENELLHEVADTVGALMEFWGFKRVMGRVWTILFLRDEPLSAAELCEQLAISSGAASMALAELEHWGVVKRSRKPGDRREYFEAETDIWKMISRVLRERELVQIERALEVFDRARDQLAKGGAPGEHARLQQISERIGRLVDLARLGRALLVAIVQQGKADLAPLMRFASVAVSRIRR